ncbi:MAG: MerC domain-containing protein [Pseudomonadota bacterium]
MHFSAIPSPSSKLVDRLGLIISLSCGLHCATMTAVLILYPALWLNHSLWEMGLWQNLLRLERFFLFLAWIFAGIAMAFAFFKYRRLGPPSLAAVGLALLTIAVTTPLHSKPFLASGIALIGGLLLAGAHGWNLMHHQKARCQASR